MNNKSLLMISNFLPQPKFNKNIWHSLAERLSEAGWTVITTSNKINRLHRLLDMIWCIWRERRHFKVAQIDVFSGKAFFFAEVCSVLLKFIKKPIILTLHGGGLPEFAAKHPRRMKILLRAGDRLATPSDFLKNELKAFHSNIQVIPNPVDISHAIYRQRDKAEPKLIWVRAFHSIYNPLMAIDVLRRLKPIFPQINLTMVGPDKLDHSLKRVMVSIKKFGLQNEVRVQLGVEHNEIPILLNKADLFINTSNYDTFPRSIIEAMANGLCVVTTNVGGIPYLANNREEALLVPPEEPVQMAAAIRQIIENKELAQRLSLNARKRAEKYDWSAILPQWEELFCEVIDTHYG
jgi:glycosyltransferase involved in cell wall biosynthesis